MPGSRLLDAANLIRSGKSHVDLSDITAALLSKKQVAGGQANPEEAEELRVSSNRLTSLETVPSCFLHTVVQHITVLDASHNQLRDLRGLELFVSLETLNLSHNQLQVLDAATVSVLLPLRQLQTVILSHNQLKYMDWDVNANHGGSLRGSAVRRSRGSFSGDVSRTGSGLRATEEDGNSLSFTIACLDLSHNELIELPDLRALPLLEELYLEDNTIEDLVDLETKLPLLHLQALTLAHNGLTACSALVPLAALGETLLHLTLGGNPFVFTTHGTVPSAAAAHSRRATSAHGAPPANELPASADGWWRPFALFLAPLLISLDETDMSADERRIAGNVLFRPRAGAALSRPLLELMNPQKNNELEAYLQRTSEGVAPSKVAPRRTSVLSGNGGGEPQPSASHDGHITANARLETVPRTAQSPHSAQYTSSVSGGSELFPAPAGAAPLPVVVKAMQGKLKSLSGVVQMLWRAHMTAVAAGDKASTSPRPRRGDPDAATIPPDSARSTASSSAADMHDVVTTMRHLQQVLTSMWGDLDEFRGVVAREQFKAALTIQRYYRGYRARCEWRVLRADYGAFVDSLSPEVQRLQRVGRGLLTRRRLGPRYEAHMLREEVRHLRSDMAELRALVHQHCRSVSPVATAPSAAKTAPAAARTESLPGRGRHVDPTPATHTEIGTDDTQAASAPLKPTRIMVRRRSRSGGSDRGDAAASVPTKPAGQPAAGRPHHSETPDRLDDLDEL